MTSAEIWIRPFEEFIKANEFAKDKSRTDLVTLTQLAQSGGKIAKQVRLLGALGQAYVKTAANGTRYVIFKACRRAARILPERVTSGTTRR